MALLLDVLNVIANLLHVRPGNNLPSLWLSATRWHPADISRREIICSGCGAHL